MFKNALYFFIYLMVLPVLAITSDAQESREDRMPQYPGGNEALFNYISQNMVYPKVSQENGNYGTVYVRFKVETSGHTDSFSIQKAIIYREKMVKIDIGNGQTKMAADVVETTDPALEAEALRVMKGMAVWKPGIQKGQKVAVGYVFPLKFRLE